MKIIFCWSVISGYMATCWQELARRPGVDLHVIAHRSHGATAFDDSLLHGLSHRYLDVPEHDDATLIRKLVEAEKPDVIAMTGWWLPAYRGLVHARNLAHVRFIMGVDTPWRTEAQFLTRFRYARSLRKFDHFFVTGERSWQYVTRLGVPAERVSRGMYGVDVAGLAAAGASRDASAWPKRFMFMGRYAREKGLDVLVSAYAAYRERVADPWPLVCCGRGPDGAALANTPGITDLGFLQPHELINQLAASGTFVMPSRFDPWPLALVEAAAAGLPIVCSDACGSAVEIVRPYFNGFVVPKESPAALADALHAIHARYADLPEWGRRAAEFAAAYSSELWADRWIAAFHALAAADRCDPRSSR
ncbi:MAG: glycosyltransferase family 4 protein [Pirellulales bacterium]